MNPNVLQSRTPCDKRVSAREEQLELETARRRLAALGIAEENVAKGDKRLARAQNWIDRLRRAGEDLSVALGTLQCLKVSHRVYLADRTRLIDEMYRDTD
jgi:enoyl-CoA hydratase/carnithine racemase